MHSIPLVFSHANSFPASTYRVLFDHLQTRGFAVKSIDKFGHDPRYPVSNNWKDMAQHVADFAQMQAEAAGGPVWLVGHSLGGFLSLMAAAKKPGLAKGVLLIDAPILGGGAPKRARVLEPRTKSSRRHVSVRHLSATCRTSDGAWRTSGPCAHVRSLAG